MKKYLILFTLFIAVLTLPTKLKAAADTALTFSPSVTSPKVGDDFDVNINIDSRDNDLVGVELYLNFDKTKLKANSITAGAYFSSPQTTTPVINNTNGTIGYVIYLSPSSLPKSGTGTLATISFEALDDGSTNLSFSTNTVVAAINENSLNALSSSPFKAITIAAAASGSGTGGTGATPTPTATPTTPPSSPATATPLNLNNVEKLPDSGNPFMAIILMLSAGFLLTTSFILIKFKRLND